TRRSIGGRPLNTIHNTLPYQGCCVDRLNTP
ncbi:hypothetical protein M2275_005156, partial [Rhodococcus opacus]|nr:hypothetical protein [Rhodococcus opacus]